MSSMRRWLPRFFFESLLIIVSIVAALAVNDWRETRQRAGRTAEARAAFANEIRSNRDLLLSEFYLPHHQKLLEQYRRADTENAPDPQTFFETGVHPAPLRDAAWRSFSSGGTLAEFRPAEMLTLSDIYHAQETLEKANTNFISAVAAPRADRNTPGYARDEIRSISMFLSDVVPSEQRLLELYARALEQLGGKGEARSR